MARISRQTRAGLGQVAIVVTAEILLTGLALFGMDALAHLRLGVAQFIGAWATWMIALVGGRVWLGWERSPRWFAWLIEWAPPAMVLCGLKGWGRGGFSPAQAAYALALVAVILHGWRAWIRSLERRGTKVTGESMRVVALGILAVAVTLPLFTDLLVGGTDARWYALMLADFIAQLRAGVFPVMVGQGEWAWNGGVHPFRTAPVFMHVAGLWDLLTLRSLGVCALQHLAAITAAFSGGIGMYAAGVALAPDRRWEAAGVATLYLLAPACLEALYGAEAYMTWMAIGVLPLALYGNAKSLISADGRGYRTLAVGLALVWMAHPPVAILTTLATLLLQFGSLLCGEVSMARIRGATVGALLFFGLGAFYFIGMSELPQREPVSVGADLLQIGGLLLWLTGWVNPVLRRRSLWWLVLLFPGGWLLATVRVPWFWWMIITSFATLVAVGLARWRRWFDPGEHAAEVILLSLGVAAAFTQAWLGENHPARDQALLEGLAANASHARQFFLPLLADVDQRGDSQPGFGLWLALGFLAVVAVRSSSLAARLWFGVTLLPIFLIVPVPWLSEFLVGFAPPWLAVNGALLMPLRLMPTAAGFLAMGWLIWLGAGRDLGRTFRVASWVVLALAGAWAAYDAMRIVRFGAKGVATRTSSENRFRSENVGLECFVYDLTPIPTYFSNGVSDPRLQARVLDELKRVTVNPDVTARRMEEHGHTLLKLVCLPYDPPTPGWMWLGPKLVLQPGEHLLMRFEFDARHDYTGFLFMKSDRGYREYALPESGLRRAFGVTAKASRVVSLWNSGVVAEQYAFYFLRGPGCNLPTDGSPFANVFISHYDPSRAQVRVDSLMPYRVTAKSDGPGFIETARVWLPGYVATVDGQPAVVRPSPERLAMVKVPAGQHTVELRFVGTPALRAAWWISAISWTGLIGGFLWRVGKCRSRED